MKEIATFEEVDEILHCDDETGLLIQKKRTSRRVRVGDVAGTVTNKGYIYVRVNGRGYMAHRVVWLLKTGVWPTGEIDHIDHDKSNNSFSNLQEVDHRSNGRNLKRSSKNTSGTTGVSWNSRLKRWIAQISDENGKSHLGCFANKDDAIAARKSAEIAYGYHPNHGKEKSSK